METPVSETVSRRLEVVDAAVHNGGVRVIGRPFGGTGPSIPRRAEPSLKPPRRLVAPTGAVPITLRPVRLSDEREWEDVRWRNRDWLDPWESGDPLGAEPPGFRRWVGLIRRSERQGTGTSMLVDLEGRIVGQVSLGAVSAGALRSGTVGYWVDRVHAGRGIAPMAVALLADWAFHGDPGPRLHRLEIAMLPGNDRSRRVAEKLHARYEGRRSRYMFVDGRWRDHDCYALLAEDWVGGSAASLVSRHA
ncbi:GNAT family protein [uncultured Bifidobacterium sp.]|uniref:GNAT family N-acetyltransferase n=1 Tax=uncultured Bifidobacterium sp. TaxID=165187 RepID=UPI0028DB6B6B|nr:GNAT family protein [uncultured Bifidobacterium sp.]